MGEVYRGIQLTLERPVAVKLLPVRLLGHRDLLQRFEREARLLSKLKHPGIVSVIDFGYADGRPYLVMELVEGTTLEAVLTDEVRLPPARVATILLELCAALDHAHSEGVLHRDLKPANILIEGQRVRVVDFGIARAIEPTGSHAITGEGMVIGTPKYCSPEQAMGMSLDARSDLYAMGIIGYRMLAGHVPFDGESPAGIFARHVEEQPVPMALAAALAPAWKPLGEVIDRLLAKIPHDRYGSAKDAAVAIEQATREMPDVTSYAPPPRDRGDPDTVLDLGSAVAEVTATVEPTIHRDPAPVTPPRGFIDRHPGIATALVVGLIALGAFVATSISAPPTPPAVILPAVAVEARALIDKGDVKRAVSKLEEAVEAAPRSPALRAALGHAYVRGDRAEDAIPHYAWAARAPDVFDADHRADLVKLSATAKTLEGRVLAMGAREKLGDKVDVLATAKEALASPRCEDKKAAIKVLADRKKKDAVPLLEGAAKDKKCGGNEARRALEVLTGA